MATAEGLELRFHQSNREYELIDWIHEAEGHCGRRHHQSGAFTHTSIAILDALNAFEGFVLEVHISNVHKREASGTILCVGSRRCVMAGFGVQAIIWRCRGWRALLGSRR